MSFSVITLRILSSNDKHAYIYYRVGFDDNENGHPTIHFVRISKLKNNEGDIPGVG